jgi:hypothetical protein
MSQAMIDYKITSFTQNPEPEVTFDVSTPVCVLECLNYSHLKHSSEFSHVCRISPLSTLFNYGYDVKKFKS